MQPPLFANDGLLQPTSLVLLASKLLCQQTVPTRADQVVLTWPEFWQIWQLTQPKIDLLEGPGVAMVLLSLREQLASKWPAEQLAQFDRRVASWADAVLLVRDAGLHAAQLLQLAAKEASLADLAHCLAVYEAYLEQASCQDQAAYRRMLLFALEQGVVPKQWQSLQEITIYTGAPLATAELDALNSFASRGVSVTIVLPWDHQRTHAFAWPGTWLEMIESRGHGLLQVEFSDHVGDGPLAPLRQAMFLPSEQAIHAPCQVLATTSTAMWSDLLARIGQALAQGRSAADILVVVPTASLQQQAVQVLTAAQLPVRAQYQLPLFSSPLLQCLLAALRLGADTKLTLQHFAPAWLGWGEPSAVQQEPLMPPAWLAWLNSLQGPIGPQLEQLLLYASQRADSLDCSAELLEASRSQIHQWQAHIGRLGQAAPLTEWLQFCLVLLEQVGSHWPPPAPSAIGMSAAQPSPRHWSQDQHYLCQWLRQLLYQATIAVPSHIWSRQQFLLWLMQQSKQATMAWQVMQPGGVQVALPGVLPQVGMVCCLGFDSDNFPAEQTEHACLPDKLRHVLHRHFDVRLPLLAANEQVNQQALAQQGLRGQGCWLWLEILAACQEQLVLLCQQDWLEDGPGPSPYVEATCQILATNDSASAATLPTTQATYMAPEQWLPLVTEPEAIEHVSEPTRQRWQQLQRKRGHYRLLTEQQWPSLPAANCSALQAHVVQRAHSVSLLDGLAACKFRYFAESCLQLKAPKTLVITSNGRTEGSLAHLALEKVYANVSQADTWQQLAHIPDTIVANVPAWLREQQALLQPLLPMQAVLWPALLLKLEQQVCSQLKQDSLIAHVRRPVALEYAFGRGQEGGPALLLAHPRHSLQLAVRGSIDRIDVETQAAGASSEPLSLVVLDYKGSLPKRSPGRHLQLGLYAAVAVRDYGLHSQIVRAVWRTLRDGKEKVAEAIPPQAQEVLAFVARQVWSRLDDVLQGRIEADAVDAQVCEYCTYRLLCRQPLRNDVALEALDGGLDGVVSA